MDSTFLKTGFVLYALVLVAGALPDTSLAMSEIENGSILHAPLTYWNTLFPEPVAYIPAAVFMAMTFIMLLAKGRTVILPTIVLYFFIASFSFLQFPLAGTLIAIVFVASLVILALKLLTNI